jgi:hypothetical protein
MEFSKSLVLFCMLYFLITNGKFQLSPKKCWSQIKTKLVSTLPKRGIAALSSSFGIQYAIDLQSLHTVACVDYIQK